MSITSRPHPDGFQIFTLSQGDEEATVSAFGGQLRSWTKNGVPILFENRDHAVDDGKTPYRGGAPICFSHFGMGTLLPLRLPAKPQHGHARTTLWQAHITEEALVLKTRQPAPEGYGPTEFDCQLVYRIGGGLRLNAVIRNVGREAAPFQFAVHSYWATSQPEKASVKGLGNEFLDNLQGLAQTSEADSAQPHATPIDRVYPQAGGRLELTTERYQLLIQTHGGSGAVVWNPGPDHTLKDVGKPDFICVENGLIFPSKTLAPDEEHVIEMVFSVNLK